MVLKVKTTIDIDVMKIKGNLEGDSVNIVRENFDKFQIGFDYEKKLLKFNPIYLKKLKSSLFFNGEIDFENDVASYQLRADELNLKDFYYFRALKLGLDGRLNLEYKHEGKIPFDNDQLTVSLFESYVENKKLEDSKFSLIYNDQILSIDTAIFKNNIVLNSSFDLRGEAASRYDLNINIKDLRDVFGILNSKNIRTNEANGSLRLHSYDFNFLIGRK